ncbi:MAG: hypothetical protein A2579_08950 [Lysobacterales bacterium RIFOXYD1_FULL_69_11]|nr:MAG: hypothetical protein A2190_01420 [Xanthomonadales bacterium RIFOXYA1_FULL_69_10]OHE86314.1 MAG: hypothetical protein A2579_08950 [Xanthomonadales bacterium RIFOXYD1_FULL_69_11]
MNMTRALTLSVALSLGAVPAAIAAQKGADGASSEACAVRMTGGWVRLPPVAMPMMAGFGRIENACGDAVAVVGVHSNAFAEVSLHETRIVDGVSRMRAVPRLAVPAGGSVELKPGGLHLMLMQPRDTLTPGDSVEVMLELEGGQTRTVELAVRAPTGR